MYNNSQKEKIPIAEYSIAVFIIAAGLLLRLVYILNYEIDSDELQHLHVVWAWLQGFLVYRDVFDNHAPVFHLLCTPLLRMIGEHSYALYIMRLTMFPIFLLSVFYTFLIARRFFSQRTALWAVVFFVIGVHPDLFFCSVEFRPDILWMTVWLVGLAVLMREQIKSPRIFLAGFLFGFAMCISMKTVLLLFSLTIAAVIDKKLPSLKSIVLFFAGILIIPSIFIGLFAWQGALKPFFYCVINHNILPGMGHWKEIWRILIFVILVPAAAFLFRRQSVLFLSAAIYILSLFSIWPIATRENFLPVYPLIAIYFADKLIRWMKRKAVFGFVFLSIAEISLLIYFHPPLENRTKEALAVIDEAIRLTDRDDWVMSKKGEHVFRPRPYYYVLETITRKRIKRGLIPDDIPDYLISKKCCVVAYDISRLSQGTREFIENNYIPISRLRIAGKILEPYAGTPDIFKFEINIPAYYVLIPEQGEIKGMLDKIPYTGARYLDAGTHEFICTDIGSKRIILLWAKAFDKGFFTPYYVKI